MPKIVLPFLNQGEGESSQNNMSEEDLLALLPEPMQEACKQSKHLLNYMRLISIDKIGVPQYCLKLTRAQADLPQKNIIYPVSENIFAHIYSEPGGGRPYYIPVEPSLTMDLTKVLSEVESGLVDVAGSLKEAESDAEREEAILGMLDKVCIVQKNGTSQSSSSVKVAKGSDGNSKSNKTKVQVTSEQFDALKYVVVRDKVGMGTIDAMIRDPNIEDISCSGLGPIFLEHRVFKGLRSSITFETHDDLDDFVLRLSEQIKRPVTLRNPIVDATLPDGSRINIVFGREVSRRGSNFTIRKFSDVPLSILELVEFGSISYEMAAYLSIVIEDGMNLFVVGETASGKTTLLNAITTFIPLSHKIVSIEDTPELQVPHGNWLREVSRAPGQGEKGAQVTMFDLLKAALRQRPNVIIVGEIRGEEGNIAFGAMQTGHEVMSTFHASNVEKLIQRLTGHPINVPKTYMDNLNVVICQNAVKLPNGKMGRRATSISEIVGYDPVANIFSYVEVFRWNPVADTFEFVGRRNSYLLEDKIALKRGIPPDKKWQIYSLVERRTRILEKLHKEKGVRDFYELLKVLAKAQEERIF
ncbi:MAG TPA: type II/IV secretion system ATPase subunit [Dehalococcoidia bacterium]|nr:type II/IV secretion system ATPase subunit [Dehalococcoidia bacterium]